jgi:hypothetical protein
MNARDAHHAVREQNLPCAHCGSLMQIKLTIDLSDQQRAEVQEAMRVLGRYMKARALVLVPVEEAASRLSGGR